MKNVYYGKLLFYLYLIELLHQGEARCRIRHGMKYFGVGCKFACHCQNVEEQCSKVTGSCRSGCSKDWMGPGCQYSNIVPQGVPRMSKSYNNKFAKLARDNNITSCSDSGTKGTNDPPWWRVTFEKQRYIRRMQFMTKDEYLGEFDEFKIMVGNTSWTDRENKKVNPPGRICYRHRDRRIVNTTIDIICDTPLFGNQIRLSLHKHTSRLVLCEIKISGGRNIAINKKTNSSKLSEYFSRSPTCVTDGFTIAERKQCVGLSSHVFEQTTLVDLENAYQFQGYKITSTDIGDLFGIKTFKYLTDMTYLMIDDVGTRDTHVFESFFFPSSISMFKINRSQERTSILKEKRLFLCEVQIWGDCVTNFCGFECTNRCFCQEWEKMSLEDRQAGICRHGCKPGWTGHNLLCNQECINGKYGQGCLQNCSGNCRHGLSCNKTNGHCSEGCENGWIGRKCDQKCSPGKYGLNCNLSCSTNCHDKNNCRPTDGKCMKGCKAGWQGDNCTDQCNAGKYGTQCASNCSGNCYKEPCRRTDGTCYNNRCKDGWKGDKCKNACDNGSYGQRCRWDCSEHCIDHMSCNNVNGTCIGGCKNGWFGTLCNKTCEPGTFGKNCETNCSSNCVNGSCRHTDGKCVHRCKIGWEGKQCDQAVAVEVSPTSSKTVVSAGTSVVGISVGVVVFVIALILVIVVLIKKRRHQTRESPVESSRIYRSPGHEQRTQSGNEDHIPSGILNQAIELEEDTGTGQEHQDADRKVNCGDNPVALDNIVEQSVYANLGPQKHLHGINIKDLKTFIETTRLDELYAEFERLPRGLQFPTEAALQETNRPKNRYKEMYPYDHCRVVLSKQPNDPYSDYINASFINGFHGTKSYIAAAAPIDTSINDFWRIIWETHIKTVVMVTHLEEAGKVKCLKYWPKINETAEYGELKVNTITEDVLAEFTVRTLLVTKTGSKQYEIFHYHYTAWPDKDVPDGCTGMIHFLQYIRTRDQTRHDPWLVHCSAGVGRTGTFVALDYLYTEGQRIGTVNIYQCVYALREQRVNCVQTREQYRFIHEVLYEIFSAPTSPTSVDVYRERCGQVNDLDPVSNLTNLELHYQSLSVLMRGSKWRDNQQNKSKANPKGQNVILAAFGKEKSRKIENACFFPSYQCQKGYIASIFSQENSHLLLKLTVQEKIELVISLDFPTHINNFQETKIVEFKYWPSYRPCPSSVESMRNFIDTVRMERGNSRKSILVLSSDSVAKCGMFCILLSMVDRVFSENEICIFQTIRHVQSRNPDIAITYDQFKFCHEFIQLYLQKENIYVNNK